MDNCGVVFFQDKLRPIINMNSFAKSSETEAGSSGEQPVEG